MVGMTLEDQMECIHRDPADEKEMVCPICKDKNVGCWTNINKKNTFECFQCKYKWKEE